MSFFLVSKLCVSTLIGCSFQSYLFFISTASNSLLFSSFLEINSGVDSCNVSCDKSNLDTLGLFFDFTSFDCEFDICLYKS